MKVNNILKENQRRNKEIHSIYNPLTGEGAVLERYVFHLSDYPIETQYLPLSLKENPLFTTLQKHKSLTKFLFSIGSTEETLTLDREKAIRQITKVRAKHDFCFWAYMFVFIKNKEGGDDIRFSLNRPQRKLVDRLERMRLSGKPIRLIMLKARQWGGSTCIQVYMAWLQLMHITGWNSIIVSHQLVSTAEVKGMFSKLMQRYPLWMLYEIGDDYKENEKNLVPFEGSQSIDYIPQRNSKIKVGTAQKPESARGGDTAMAHCTEVAFWEKTENKTPEQIVRSACAGMSYAPLTLEIFESTANGTGNYFADEWDRAKEGTSDKEPLFISWFEIEKYAMPVENIEHFATELFENRNNPHNNGKYNWWLWEQGATLEALNWYIHNRKRFHDHADMAAEYPSDDVEAFKHSGQKVFDLYKVEAMSKKCRDPKFIGEVRGFAPNGSDALREIHFNEDRHGELKVWEHPEHDIEVRDRYLVVVDVGGRADTSDYSVIWVLDRYWMMEGDKPQTVAQWRGHIRHDVLAWKAAQIATYYNKALLVIESNTFETKDRDTDGDHTETILGQLSNNYSNLYARDQSAEDISTSAPRKWGFHTNVSTKVAIIDNLVATIEEGSYIERDKEALNEFLTYEKRQNGSFGAILGKHDDMLMTRAIGLYISSFKMDLPKIIEKKIAIKRKNLGLASTI